MKAQSIMKISSVLTSGLCLLFAMAPSALADEPAAPASITGAPILVSVQFGTGQLSTNGYYWMYQPSDYLFGYFGADGISNTMGYYSYTNLGAAGTAMLEITDAHGETIDQAQLTFDFTNLNSGTATTLHGSDTQTGIFQLANASLPTSLLGQAITFTATDGAKPMASSGRAVMSFASSNAYSLTPLSGGFSSSTGVILQSGIGPSGPLLAFNVNDSVFGTATYRLGFQTTNSGFYLLVGSVSNIFQYLIVGLTADVFQVGTFTISNTVPAPFFSGQVDLGGNVEYLTFPNGTNFGYYNLGFTFPYFYHYDLGFEYFFDANNTNHGCYLYDFTSSAFFYTDIKSFPSLYDFSLNSWIYYYPNTTNAGHYTSQPRYFYNYTTNGIFTK